MITEGNVHYRSCPAGETEGGRIVCCKTQIEEEGETPVVFPGCSVFMRFFKYSISWKEYLTPIITALNVLIINFKVTNEGKKYERTNTQASGILGELVSQNPCLEGGWLVF